MAFQWHDDNGREKSVQISEFGGVTDSVLSAFRRVFDYTGRSTRSEFWWFSLLSLAMNIASYRVSNYVFKVIMGINNNESVFLLSIFASLIVALVTLIIWLPLAIRRVRDAGKSPFWVMSYALPISMIVGAEFIKGEYLRNFFIIYTIIFWIVIIGMVVVYLMPSKFNDETDR